MNVIIEWIISILIIISGLLSVLAAVGVIRLPDVYTRTHAAGVSNTFGVSLLLFTTVGYFFHSGEGFNARLILAILFIYLTTPVASHFINRAAYDTGVPLAIRVRDQLRSVKKEDIKQRRNLIIRQEQVEKARQEKEELEDRLEWDREVERIEKQDHEEEEAREKESETVEKQEEDSEGEIIAEEEEENKTEDQKEEK